MELGALSNEDLFERWRRQLLLKYRTERPRKEAYRVIGLFEKYLGGRRPSADLAKEYPKKAEAEIAALREAVKGMTTEQIREFLGMKKAE